MESIFLRFSTVLQQLLLTLYKVSDRDAGVSILEPGLATQLPMETKQRADDQRRWYRQFARYSTVQYRTVQ